MAGFAFASGEALDCAFRQVMKRQLRAAGRALATEEASEHFPAKWITVGRKKVLKANNLDRLADPQGSENGLAVHRARRCLKRSRALLALLYPAFRKKRWAKEARALKRAGQQLSGARDEQAKLDALEKLAARDRRAAGASTINMLRKVIEARRAKLERAVAHELKRDLARDLDRLGERFRRKRLKRFDEDALRDGIAETYRRGRRAMRWAYESGRDEDFHAWRREVQTHWRHMQLIEACAPAEARPRAEAAKVLSGLLGDDHDLWLLLNDLDRPSLPLAAATRQRLKRAIAKAQAALRQEAQGVGERLFAEMPKQLGKRLKRAWRTVVEVEAAPIEVVKLGEGMPLIAASVPLAA